MYICSQFILNNNGGFSRWELMSLGAYVVGANVAVAFVAVANVVGGLCRDPLLFHKNQLRN